MRRRARTLADARRWTVLGTEMLTRSLSDDPSWLRAPSALPEWNRRQLLAHLAGNADALGNLVRWAATGLRTDMYASAEERAAGIASGLDLPAGHLLSWVRGSAGRLNAAMGALSHAQWRTEVVTAQGRAVSAEEIPWMRAREVLVHVVDLASAVGFADLPDDFLGALCDDVIARRSKLPGPHVSLVTSDTGEQWRLPGEGPDVTLTGPLHRIAAYLTGRPHRPISDPGTPEPRLGSWL